MSSEGTWLASDGHRYPRESPPSATPALVWTVVATFWLWILLPVAVHYTRKARQEAESSGGRYKWSSRNLLHRPVLLWLTVLGTCLALVFVMAGAGAYGP